MKRVGEIKEAKEEIEDKNVLFSTFSTALDKIINIEC
tara:strand:- start:223 stop:333 length:111 start_codon:yes stop_codon:yes gene_type:complete